jgi:hypothetical protein
MHGPPNMAQLLPIAGICFECEPRTIHPVQKFLGALEEDLEQFRSLLFGMEAHWAALSMR